MRQIKKLELNNIGGGCSFLEAFGDNPNLVIILPNGHPTLDFTPPVPEAAPMECPTPCGPECYEAPAV